MIKLMVKVITFMQKVLHIKGDGTRTNKKEKAEKNGLMAHTFKVNTLKGRNTEKEYSNGLMVPNMKDFGKTIRCMVTENLDGLTVVYIKGITQTTKNMAKEFTHGQTVECTMEDSIMENNTVKVSTDKAMAKKFTAYG
jgi:hypothetical protein